MLTGYYQDFVLNAMPNCWSDLAQVAFAAFKVIFYREKYLNAEFAQIFGSSLLCALAIMLYSDLALPGVICCFGWILSRISHSETDDVFHSDRRQQLDKKLSKRHFSLSSPNTKELLMQRVASLALPSQQQNANGNGFSKCFRHLRSGSIH